MDMKLPIFLIAATIVILMGGSNYNILLSLHLHHPNKTIDFGHMIDCSSVGFNNTMIKSEYHLGEYGLCKSRYEQHCFWNPSKYTPSQGFQKAIKSYESMHHLCTSEQNLDEIFLRNESNGMCKYMVWVPHDGLGNRIISLTSAFVYSLITNRALLISNESGFQDLFCEPFAKSSWILPQTFPLQNLKKTAEYHSTFYNRMQGLANQGSGNFNWSSLNGSDFPTKVGVYIQWFSNGQDFRFFCPKEQELMENVTWIYFDSTEFIAPAFYYVPRFRKALNFLFPDRALFLHAARYLFSPKDEVWGMIKDFYREDFVEADSRIGIQIRAWGNQYHPIINSHVLACAMEMGMLPNPWTEKPEDKIQKTAVLVTSLLSEYHQNLSNSYLNVSGNRIRVYTASSEKFQQTGRKDHDVTAVVDMWLLSFMDDMISTAKSTFGFVGHGLGGIIPVVLRNFGMHESRIPDPPCFRTNLAGPCFLYPPIGVQCPLNPGEGGAGEENTQVPEVTECVLDRGVGIHQG